MGKRSEKDTAFVKKPRDYYPTIDPAAVKGFAWEGTKFIEPCAGNGSLIRLLEGVGGVCVGAYDIDPQGPDIVQRNCFSLAESDLEDAQVFVTNPPFSWVMLQPIMDHLVSLLPTMVLLPADYMHNVRMGPYMKKCVEVHSIGRMYWEENKIEGVDNYCWYLFIKDFNGKTAFVGRQ